MIKQAQIGPTTERQRHVILDALRGLALMGIALANFPEFGLWTFLSSEEQTSMPTAGINEIVRFLQYLLVDGKFYTIFSLLFGIGFSLILARHGRRLFVRRMLILVCIGFQSIYLTKCLTLCDFDGKERGGLHFFISTVV